MKSWIGGLVAFAGMASLSVPAFSAPELIVNGGFEQASTTTATQLGRTGVAGATLTGWTNNGYNFMFTPGSADTTGSYSTEYNNYLKLWSANNGGAAGNALPSTSPLGGNYIGADGAYQTGSITQTVNGLTIGENYQLSFYWAAAQQYGYTGNTTESWIVNFGSQSYNTATVLTPSKGFTPWRQETVYFTAAATSQVLSFLARGTPSGVPPFSLLDGVSLVAAPEPATWAVMMIGLGGVTFLLRRRRNSARENAPAFAA